MSSVRFEGIAKRFGATPVLRDVSLDIADGEFLTLLGPSGCGKSTLLRVLAGLEQPDAGTVSIGDRPVDGLRPKHRDVAMVFQSYALYPHMSVFDNMATPLRMRRLNSWQRLPAIGRLFGGSAAKLKIREDVEATAKALSIDHLLGRKPGQLSGGQRQRVAVGRAMVRHPAVFLMDEPLSNLDAKLRVQMRAEIKDLHRRLGVTFIYVTHDQAEAMTLSDRVAVMLDGELLQVATPQSIYADPVDRRVAEFIGSPKINMIAASARDAGHVHAAGATLSVATGLEPGRALSLGIRSEAFALADGDGLNTISGAVRLIEHMGSDIYVHVDVPGTAEPLIARLPAGQEGGGLRLGWPVHLKLQPEHVLLFGETGARWRTSTAANASVTPIRSIRS